MRKFSKLIDTINTRIGSSLKWLVLAMVLVATYNATARYIASDTAFGRSLPFPITSNALIEAQWYLFSLIFLLGAAWVFKDDKHVRVDILYNRVSTRTKNWINLLGSLFFLLPFCAYTIYFCYPWVINSWKVYEWSSDPGGLPRFPLKTALLLALILLFLQGCSESIKAYYNLKRDKN